MADFIYPTPGRIIEYNVLALNIIKAKKADKAEVLKHSVLSSVINQMENKEGDVYDKATVLLKGLIQGHPFASGNRRTAFIVTKDFILKNKGRFGIADNVSDARVMQGIRENYYSESEIKEWLKNGKIRKFER